MNHQNLWLKLAVLDCFLFQIWPFLSQCLSVLDAKLNPPNRISLDWRLKVPPTTTSQWILPVYIIYQTFPIEIRDVRFHVWHCLATGTSQLPPKHCWFQLPNHAKQFVWFVCMLPLQKSKIWPHSCQFSRVCSLEPQPNRAMFGPKPKIQSQNFDKKNEL